MEVIKYIFYAPKMEWIYFILFVFGIIAFITAAEKGRSKFGWPLEVNRKLVHILTGVLVFFTPFVFKSRAPLIWMGIIFVFVNLYSLRSGRLTGMHDTKRKSLGTVFYPISFIIILIAFWKNFKSVIMISMLILAISDAIAAIAGERSKNPHSYSTGLEKKTVEGSIAMFLSTFLIVIIIFPAISYIDGYKIGITSALWIAIITAITATSLESISIYGSDNLSVPLGSAFILHFMVVHSTGANLQLSTGVILAAVISVVSYYAHFLTLGGSIATFILGLFIFGIGGWPWAVPILVFFLTSSLLSKVGGKSKRRFKDIFEKTSRRDVGQVFANGGLAGLIILVYSYWPNSIFYYLYLGILAAVTADTWATEIGILSKSNPVSIQNFKRVEPGSSGGITLLGTAASFVGSLTIPLSALIVLFMSNSPRLVISKFTFWLIGFGGFAGSIVDTILGAIVQAQYQCIKCNKKTEKKIHCKGEKGRLISGIGWFNNDLVNTFCCFTGFVFVLIGKILNFD